MEILLGLLGGLTLFLYGMQMMSSGLEAVAGDRMKSILEKLTSNRFVGVLVGCLITMVIQSSSATTVMVVGFVNAQMMTLRQAVWVIMGANIGTTVTGQLIALDIGAIAPLIAFLGVVLVVFMKGQTKRQIGEIIAGLGILFLGMNMMSSAMTPLREMPAFVNAVSHFSNPLVGILVGAGFTALIQSSSASVGVMQALALSGIVDLHTAVYVLFGQNIGTCITAVLASIGASREAKQTTVIHLSFNIIGTIIFTIICMSTPLTDFVMSWTPKDAPQQIANMHTLFNVCTTILLIPFGYKLADFAEKVLPSEDRKEDSVLQYLQPIPKSNKMVGSAAINIYQVSDEIIHMMNLAYKNIDDAFKQLIQFTSDRSDEIVKREDTVNILNTEISDYISAALANPNVNANSSQALASFYLSLVHLERMSDYAKNINYQARKGIQNRLSREDQAIILEMADLTSEGQEKIYDYKAMKAISRKAHARTHEWRQMQINEIKENQLDSEAGIMMSRIFNDFLRINDHAEDVAEEFDQIELDLNEDSIDQKAELQQA